MRQFKKIPLKETFLDFYLFFCHFPSGLTDTSKSWTFWDFGRKDGHKTQKKHFQNEKKNGSL